MSPPQGSECFAVSEKGYLYAKSIQKQLVGLGFTDRGVKDGSHLYVVSNTQAPAVLVESFFVDSRSDCDRFDSLGIEKIAEAIFKGICEAA
jgi:N-acetylmuramoyl-L-alanine amidase